MYKMPSFLTVNCPALKPPPNLIIPLKQDESSFILLLVEHCPPIICI